jgi:GntR family transcriptional regulator
VAVVLKPPKRATAVAKTIRELIDEELHPGDQLPSEAEFVRRLGVSRVTVREAITQLWIEGLVIRRWGAGTFVRERPASTQGTVTNIYVDLGEIGSLPHRIEAAGHRAGLSHAEIRRIASPDDIAEELGVRAGDPIWRADRCLTVDDRPGLVLRDHFPLEIGGTPFDPTRLTDINTYVPSLIQRTGLRVVRDEARLQAVLADELVAGLLGVPEGSPILHARQNSYADSGDVVVSTRAYYRSDVYSILLVRTVPS